MNAKRRKLALTIGAMVIVLAFIIFLIYYGFLGGQKEEVGQENYCNPSDKENDVCTFEYKPVCGWFDPEKVQCIKYPCAQTYSNSCMACIEDNVLYWTEGECPE